VLQDVVSQSSDDAIKGPLLIELSYHHLMHGDTASQAKAAQEALSGAREHHDRLREVAATAQLMLTHINQGDVSQAESYQDEAARAIEAMPGTALSEDLDACCHLAMGEILLERFTAARQHIELVTELARSAGRGHVLLQATVLSALVQRRLGDIQGAWRCTDEALEIARFTGSERWRMTVLVLRCELAIISGDPAEALTIGAEAARLAATPADSWIVRHVPTLLAVARFFTGQRDGCVTEITESFGGADLPRLEAATRALVYETLTWMEVLTGHVIRASRWAKRARQVVADTRLPCSAGYAELAMSHVALIGRPRRAREHARRAGELFTGAGAQYEACRARYSEAVATLVSGDVRGGRRRIAAAEAAIEACGARLPVSLSLSIPVRTSPLASLSPRERQVADLVARGETNRRIARALGMSEKTVETHMSRIFGKLGAANRAMVASMVRDGERRASQGFP
jgi:DNA-binding CsgD family transcriptional regulator